MDFINILDVECTGDIATVVGAIKTVFTLIQWAIPLVLIVMGTIDMFKAMASGDEKKTKESKEKFIRRLIYAVVAFLIPFIISLVFTFVGNMFGNDSASNALQEFLSCWDGTHNNSKEEVGACRWQNDQLSDGVTKSNCESAGGKFLG